MNALDPSDPADRRDPRDPSGAPRPAVSAAPTTFSGAVLCGGRSRRMGRDKALVEVDGQPLALRVARALRAAGAAEVMAVGGDAVALGVLGLAVAPDDPPGLGPIGGIVTALRAATHEVVFVVPCDLLDPSPAAIIATLRALAGDPAADVAVPRVGGRPQWVHSAWRRSGLAAVERQVAQGERAVHRVVAAAELAVAEVVGLAPGTVADADVPADLPDA